MTGIFTPPDPLLDRGNKKDSPPTPMRLVSSLKLPTQQTPPRVYPIATQPRYVPLDLESLAETYQRQGVSL